MRCLARAVELRRVGDAVVAARGACAGPARRRAAPSVVGEHVALGALDVAVERAGGDAPARVRGDQRLAAAHELRAVRERVLAGGAAAGRAARTGARVARLPLALGRRAARLALRGALALAGGVVAQRRR